MQRSRNRRGLALVLAGVLATAPALALASDAPVEPDTVNWTKFFDYALCAGGIAAAATGGGLFVAGLACGRLVVIYGND